MIATESREYRKVRLHRRGGENRYELKKRFAELCDERSILLVLTLRDAASWTQEKDARRCALIDKSLHSALTRSEQNELTRLQQQAESHFDEVAPPPIDGALKLHAELLKLKAARRND
jgi:hypothetical protein